VSDRSPTVQIPGSKAIVFQHVMVERAITLDGTSSGEHGAGMGKAVSDISLEYTVVRT
jgi:hypothetical protein